MNTTANEPTNDELRLAALKRCPGAVVHINHRKHTMRVDYLEAGGRLKSTAFIKAKSHRELLGKIEKEI